MSSKYANIAKMVVRTLLVVKIAPFVFTVGHIVCLILYLSGGDNVLLLADTMFYTSPMTIGLLLILSKIYQLCKWHRLQCFIPLFPVLVGVMDKFVVELSATLTYINIYTCLIMFVLTLLNAYKMFLCNGKDRE